MGKGLSAQVLSLRAISGDEDNSKTLELSGKMPHLTMETYNTIIVSIVNSPSSEFPDPNRERILKAASEVFFSRGFHRVSMDALASELRMSKKTLYSHFESKKALLENVLRELTLQINAGMMEILETGRPFDEKLRHLISFLHRRMAKVHPGFLEDVRLYAPESWKIIEEFRGRMIPVYFGRILEEGVQGGFIRGDLNAPLFLRLLLNAVQGMMNPTVLTESGASPNSVLEGILGILFTGVLTPLGRKKFKP
jgi:AcrR family transcriptional regulator